MVKEIEYETDLDCSTYVDSDAILPDTLGQYTGLKDKNGKEIYEGDIVIMHYFFENYGADLGVFEDEAEIIGTVCINEYHTFVKSKNGDVYSLCDYIQEPSEELEVIGNIYENQDLLKGEL